MQPPRPVRPLGILLSAIALGLAALLLVFLSVGGLITLASASHAVGSFGVAGASPAAFTAMTLGVTLLYLALAAWAVATLFGLLRMRPWARVSTIVIASCLVGFGLLFTLGMTGAQSLISSGSVPLPNNADPALLHKVLLVFAGLSLLLAGLGVVWLIYFASRATREAFLQAQPPSPDAHLPVLPAASAAGPPPSFAPGTRTWPAASRPLDPLTDFTVARPLEAPAPAPPPPAADWQDAAQPNPPNPDEKP